MYYMTAIDSPQIQTRHTHVAPGWRRWFATFKTVLPLYIAIHLACFVITGLAVLFTMRDFSGEAKPIYVLWQSWHRWDTDYYIVIAQQGYVEPTQTAFFPLYSIIIRGFMFVIHNTFIAGLVVSSLADLVVLIVFYRLVADDFNNERAIRAILYLSLFPTAFFLLAVYNEALFLCMTLLSFYSMHRGHWWLAGLFGLLATLTRSAGLLLVLPFCYEYLYQHQFKLSKIRFDVLAVALMPLGLMLYGAYCYYRFHDFLAFSHAQIHWNRYVGLPWVGLTYSFRAITTSTGLLSFQALRNLTDLIPDLLVLLLIVLIFVGPWRFPRKLWAYGIYAAGLYLFFMLFPMGGTGLFPLQSTSRFMLEVFPAFAVLAGLRERSTLGLSYVLIAGACFFFLLTQFLTGHWVL